MDEVQTAQGVPQVHSGNGIQDVQLRRDPFLHPAARRRFRGLHLPRSGQRVSRLRKQPNRKLE